jgi:outer membrane protein
MNKRIYQRLALAAALVLTRAVPARAQNGEKLTLRQAVTLALENSRGLKLARVQYEVALNEAGVDRAAFRPNLYTGAGYVYTHGFPATPGGGPPSIFQLDYTQSIFSPWLKGQQRAAEERAKNQKLEMERVRDDVIVRTATSYLELAKVRHALELTRSEQASAEKILGVTRERVAASQELPIEVTRSQLTLARTEERIVKLEGREETLSEQMRDLTGLSDTQSIEVEREEPSFVSDQQESELVGLALENDREIQQAETERVAREHILRGAHLSYWPSVDLIGQYSVLSKFNNYGDFYKKFERNNVNVGLQVTIPLFAAKTSANVRLAKTQLEEAELMLGSKRQQVRLDVQQKARNVRELDAAREVARLDLELTQQTVQLLQAKFDQGRATLSEIEQARLEESDKWIGFLDATFARDQGQLALLQSTGQLAKVFQ